MQQNQQLINLVFQLIRDSVGVQVAQLLLEHATWKTRHSYEDGSLIVVSEDGISLDGLASLSADRMDAVVNEFMRAIFNTLERLVGSRLTTQLINKVDGLFKEGGNFCLELQPELQH